MIYLDLNTTHSLAAANAHYYKEPTDEHYIDRTIHYHDFIYLIDGSWCFTENDIEYPLAKDDVLLLAAGRHHYSRLPCAPGTRTFCLHISCEEGDKDTNPGSTKLPTLMNVKNCPEVKKCFYDIVSTYWMEKPYKEQKLSALVNLLLVTLYEEYESQIAKKTDIATKAIEIITTQPHKRHSAKEVADILHVSTKTLDNAMKKKLGVPFYTFCKNQRLEMVATQLEMEPELKLRDIAASFCFTDEFHLSKAFKQKFGISPQEYRTKTLEAMNSENIH